MKEKKTTVYDNASELCNEVPEICLNESKVLSHAKKKSCVINMILLIYFSKHIIVIPDLKMKSQLIQQKMVKKNLRKQEKVLKKNLLVYHPWHEEGVKEEKRLKIFIPKKLLTRLPVILAQIKARNNS